MKKQKKKGRVAPNRSGGGEGVFVNIVMIYLGRIRLVKKQKRVGCPRAVKSKPLLADRQKLYDKRKTNERPWEDKSDKIKAHRYPPSPPPQPLL